MTMVDSMRQFNYFGQGQVPLSSGDDVEQLEREIESVMNMRPSGTAVGWKREGFDNNLVNMTTAGFDKAKG